MSSIFSIQVLLMLAVDAFLTILTWLLLEIYCFIIADGFLTLDSQHWTVFAILYVLNLTSVFSSSIVYYLLSTNFKVNATNIMINLCVV